MEQKATKNDIAAVAFWQLTMMVGPPVALVLPLLAAYLLGGFEDFQLINKPVTFLQSIGILGAICFPFGTFLLARSNWNQARARVSRSWPTVSGHVQSSEMQRRITGFLMILWKLALSYNYSVSGYSYRGDAVQFGAKYVSSKELIETHAKKYAQGTTVIVHYDPDDPGTSVIETSDEMARQNRWQIWAYFLSPLVISIVIAIKHAGL